jgi:hypothetical protein
VLLVFGAPCQLPSLAGQEHGRTIPLTDNPSLAGHWLDLKITGPDLIQVKAASRS